ncbi:MAG: ABC transporter permease, partial [Bradyrhizobium sp.]|uniref:ABC transporter permease n=1 Tax=Bradyrhizobium sp. TaxID=376 RepID=UPI001DDB87F6
MSEAALIGEAAAAGGGAARPRRSRAVMRFRRHCLAMFGLAAIALLVVAVIVGPSLIPFDELHIDIRHRFAPPLLDGHVFGTDQLGRDLLVRILSGGRISLAIGFAAMVISMIFGTTIGLAAGYYGGAVNAMLMRFVDAVLCFPPVFLLLVLAAFITPSIAMITLVIAATSWMEVARVVQSQIKALRERDFTLAA